MSRESEEPESTDTAPEPRPRMLLPVMLAVLLGAAITILTGGAIMHFKQVSALKTEMSTLKLSNKKQAAAIDELLGQIEDLSNQMRALKDYSIARSTPGPEKGKKAATPAKLDTPAPASAEPRAASTKTDEPAPPSVPAQPTQALPDKKTITPEPAAAPAKPKEPPRESCDLMGKTPEEQAAILKRCVGAMDTVPPAEKAGNAKGSRK